MASNRPFHPTQLGPGCLRPPPKMGEDIGGKTSGACLRPRHGRAAGNMTTPLRSKPSFGFWFYWHLSLSLCSHTDLVTQGFLLASVCRWFGCEGAAAAEGKTPTPKKTGRRVELEKKRDRLGMSFYGFLFQVVFLFVGAGGVFFRHEAASLLFQDA